MVACGSSCSVGECFKVLSLSSESALSGGILFCRNLDFQILAKTHGLQSMVSMRFLSALIAPHWKVLRS